MQPQLCVPHLSPRRLMISDGPTGERYSTRDNRVSHAAQAPKCACVRACACTQARKHAAMLALPPFCGERASNDCVAWGILSIVPWSTGRVFATLSSAARIGSGDKRITVAACLRCVSLQPASMLPFFAAHDWHRLCRSCCLLCTAECGVGDGRRAARRTKCGGSWAGSAGWCAPAAWRVQRRGAR